MKQIRDLNFLTFWLSLGNQHFGPNAYVNSICFKSNVCTGHKHDPKHLLRPKKSRNIITKILRFQIIRKQRIFMIMFLDFFGLKRCLGSCLWPVQTLFFKQIVLTLVFEPKCWFPNESQKVKKFRSLICFIWG